MSELKGRGEGITQRQSREIKKKKEIGKEKEKIYIFTDEET